LTEKSTFNSSQSKLKDLPISSSNYSHKSYMDKAYELPITNLSGTIEKTNPVSNPDRITSRSIGYSQQLDNSKYHFSKPGIGIGESMDYAGSNDFSRDLKDKSSIKNDYEPKPRNKDHIYPIQFN
jgi:hypothetical protein